MLLLVRTLHILAAIWFTCGVAGYVVTRAAMSKSDDFRAMQALVALMARFRNFFIRPGGALLVIFGLWTSYEEAWPRFTVEAIVLLVILVPFMVLTAKGSLRIETASAEAAQGGAITPALRAAMRDRKLTTGEGGLVILTILFLLLMLVKR